MIPLYSQRLFMVTIKLDKASFGAVVSNFGSFCVRKGQKLSKIWLISQNRNRTYINYQKFRTIIFRTLNFRTKNFGQKITRISDFRTKISDKLNDHLNFKNWPFFQYFFARMTTVMSIKLSKILKFKNLASATVDNTYIWYQNKNWP